MTYHWSNDPTEAGTLLREADAIEVAGCVECEGGVERCDRAEGATFFSVYLHFTPEWGADPTGLAGALCIADRDSLAEARAFADWLGRLRAVPVHDFT